ncbi:hypothetical protein HYX15_02720 [Candidatus Woesearchaeota archaeon]|nr:hypothetical protein [Candidatus Woesearchaeota archaeon]
MINMDYFKKIEDMQNKFLENPRQGIINMIKQEKELMKELPSLPIFENRPDRLKLFLDLHKEYANLMGKMMELRILDNKILKDDLETVMAMQRMKEEARTVEEYNKRENIDEVIALRLGRMYLSSIETLWKKLKNIIFFFGLNPNNTHLDIIKLKNKIEKIEREHNLKLPKIKLYIDSKLRNCVGHESTYFSPPNTVVFLDKRGNTLRVIAKLTTEEIYELSIDVKIAILAIVSVTNTALVSKIEPLLKLDDKELNHFIETGKITDEMEKKLIS